MAIRELILGQRRSDHSWSEQLKAPFRVIPTAPLSARFSTGPKIFEKNLGSASKSHNRLFIKSFRHNGIKVRSHLYFLPAPTTSARRSSQGASQFSPTRRPFEIYRGTGISGISQPTLTRANVRPPGKWKLSEPGILNRGCTPAVSKHEGFTKGSTWKLNKIYRETPYRPLGSILWGNYLNPALRCRYMAELVPVQSAVSIASRSRLRVESL